MVIYYIYIVFFSPMSAGLFVRFCYRADIFSLVGAVQHLVNFMRSCSLRYFYPVIPFEYVLGNIVSLLYY